MKIFYEKVLVQSLQRHPDEVKILFLNLSLQIQVISLQSTTIIMGLRGSNHYLSTFDENLTQEVIYYDFIYFP